MVVEEGEVVFPYVVMVATPPLPYHPLWVTKKLLLYFLLLMNSCWPVADEERSLAAADDDDWVLHDHQD